MLRISRSKLFNQTKLIQIWNNKKNSNWKKLNKSKDHLFKKKIYNNKFMMRMTNRIIIKKKFTKLWKKDKKVRINKQNKK